MTVMVQMFERNAKRAFPLTSSTRETGTRVGETERENRVEIPDTV